MSVFARLRVDSVLRPPGQMLALEPRYLFDAAAVTATTDAIAEPASTDSTTSTKDTTQQSAETLLVAIEPTAVELLVDGQTFGVVENTPQGAELLELLDGSFGDGFIDTAPATGLLTFDIIDATGAVVVDGPFEISNDGRILVLDPTLVDHELYDNPDPALDGFLSLTVRATDSSGNTDTTTIAIRVVDISPEAPNINGTVPDQVILAGTTLILDIDASINPDDDDDHHDAPEDPTDPINYALFNGPLGASIDPNTGLITWNTTSDQVGTTTITVLVSNNFDPEQTNSFQFNVTVDPAPVSTINDATDIGTQTSSSPPETSEPSTEPIEIESEAEILTAEEESRETETEEQQVEEALEPTPAEDMAATETSGSEESNTSGELSAEQIAETESFIANLDPSTQMAVPAAGPESGSGMPADAPPSPKLVAEIIDIIRACGG